MSSSSSVSGLGSNQAHTKFSTKKLFVFNNRYESGNYNNDGYDPEPLAEGTVMGRIGSSGLFTPFRSDATDGSQFPIGVLAQEYDVDEGSTVEITICVSGDVDESQLVFEKSGDTLNTVISNRRVRDLLQAESVGIKLVSSTEMTDYDNE